MAGLLGGRRILVLEDEFLIAMDVEMLCRDNGAAEVTILRSLEEAADFEALDGMDAAILDVMLGGRQTTDFAEKLQGKNVPFLFASGYSNVDGLADRFPGVRLISKPYAGNDLVEAVASICRASDGD